MPSHDEHPEPTDDQTRESAESERPMDERPDQQPTADEPTIDDTQSGGASSHDDSDTESHDDHHEWHGRGGHKPRDPRRRGGEWRAMPDMQHVHDEHGHRRCHHGPDGRSPEEHDRMAFAWRMHRGFGPGHGFGPRPGFVPDGLGRGGRPMPHDDDHRGQHRGRGRRMDARILRTARTIRKAEHVLGADALEQTLRESVSHADYVTTLRTLRTLSRAARERAFDAR